MQNHCFSGKFRFFIIGILFFLQPILVCGDTPMAMPDLNEVKEFWSPSHGFVARSRFMDAVTEVRAASASETIWKVDGFFNWAFLSDDGEHFVTGYSGMNLISVDYEPSDVLLTFWKRNAKIKEITVKDLFPDGKGLVKTVSHYHWGNILGFRENNVLEVRIGESENVCFDATTGKQIP